MDGGRIFRLVATSTSSTLFDESASVEGSFSVTLFPTLSLPAAGRFETNHAMKKEAEHTRHSFNIYSTSTKA